MTDTGDDHLPEANYEGERYFWTCGDCLNGEYTEWDPRGMVVTCDMCGLRQVVPG